MNINNKNNKFSIGQILKHDIVPSPLQVVSVIFSTDGIEYLCRDSNGGLTAYKESELELHDQYLSTGEVVL